MFCSCFPSFPWLDWLDLMPRRQEQSRCTLAAHNVNAESPTTSVLRKLRSFTRRYSHIRTVLLLFYYWKSYTRYCPATLLLGLPLVGFHHIVHAEGYKDMSLNRASVLSREVECYERHLVYFEDRSFRTRMIQVWNEKWNEKCNDLKCVQKPT